VTSDIDVAGLTHPGLKRATNADHFLIGSFHRVLKVHATSMSRDLGPSETESRGFVLLVADGVGALDSAGHGSAHALTAVAQHLLHATELCSDMAMTREESAVEHLREAVLEAHRSLLEFSAQENEGRHATTLTMYAAFWPRAFVLHVGDSRLYRLRGEDFRRLTTDQTMAEVMVEAGAMTRSAADSSQLKHVLWSAVGANEIAPEVVVSDCDRSDVILLCSDGLTKHVTDDEIRAAMSVPDPSAAICDRLIKLTLERGASDNVTVVVGRVKDLA
jgi:protein phosphatase